MGPKYEFTGETKKWGGHTLHQIKRYSDGKLGGWIESKDNLSQDGSCWIDDRAVVLGNVKVYGNAQVYGDAILEGGAQIYGNAKVSGNAWVHGKAQVYDNVEVLDDAKISGNAKVYGSAHIYGIAAIYGNALVYGDATICSADVYGNASVYDDAKVYRGTKIHGDAEIYGDEKIFHGEYTTGKFFGNKDLSKNSETKKVVQDFIYKVDNSDKLTTQTEYDSIDEFFSEPIANDIKLDTLVICTVDTKEPLIKLQKVEAEDKTEFKFIVDITNKDGDDIIFRSMIKSQAQFDQLLRQAIDLLEDNPKFSEYGYELEEGLLSL